MAISDETRAKVRKATGCGKRGKDGLGVPHSGSALAKVHSCDRCLDRLIEEMVGPDPVPGRDAQRDDAGHVNLAWLVIQSGFLRVETSKHGTGPAVWRLVLRGKPLTKWTGGNPAHVLAAVRLLGERGVAEARGAICE